jgi:hypothetical protein
MGHIRTISVVLAIGTAVGCSSSKSSSAPLDPSGKFATLDELLANSDVQDAIALLPAGDGVAAGKYYEGSTPADITGTWSTDCCGGSTGVWDVSSTTGFGGTITYDVVSPGRVDVPVETGSQSTSDGTGSFIVGNGNDVTVFLQLAETCAADGEHIREVDIDRFVYGPSALTAYSRSYVVLARDNPNGPWNCATQPVGSGSYTVSPAVFALDN